MKYLILLFFFLAYISTFQIRNLSAVPWPFKTCGDGDFIVSQFSWSQKPLAGKLLTMQIIGTTKTKTTFEEAIIALFGEGHPINVNIDTWRKTYNPGQSIKYQYQYQLPASSANYSNTIAFYSPTDDQLACITVSYSL